MIRTTIVLIGGTEVSFNCKDDDKIDLKNHDMTKDMHLETGLNMLINHRNILYITHNKIKEKEDEQCKE